MTSRDENTEGCAECSPSMIVEIACHGRRIERMAEVTAEKKTELAGFEASYATYNNMAVILA